GYWYYLRGDWGAARDSWFDALAEDPRRELQVVVLAFIGRSFGQQNRDEEAIKYLTQAVAVLEQNVGDIHPEEFLTGYLGKEKEALFADLIDLLVRNGQFANAFDYAERARARAPLLGLGNRRIEPRDGADAQLVAEAEELRKQIIAMERK